MLSEFENFLDSKISADRPILAVSPWRPELIVYTHDSQMPGYQIHCQQAANPKKSQVKKTRDSSK